MAHGAGTDGHKVLAAFASPLAIVDEDRATLYSDIVCAALLAVLAARRIDLSDEARATITACNDTETLTAWIGRAATADSIEDVLD